MKTIRRTLRPFLAAALFLALLVPLPAANWQTATIDVSPARVTHSFALGANSAGDPVFFFEESATGYASARFSAWLDLDQPITLFDWTAGDSLTLDFAAGTSLDARHALWDSGTGLPRQYFLLPAAFSWDEFALVHPDGTTYPVTKGSSIALTTASGPAFEGSALFTPGQEFWLVDLQTYSRSPSWETYLVSTPWTYDPTLRPLLPATLYLEGREDGHYFTVHSFAAGGPVSVQSVQALVGTTGGWVTGVGGGSFAVYAGSAVLSFPVGRGMEFWVTRDADIPPIESAHWIADDSAGSPLAEPLYGVYPATPQRPTELRTFRVNIQRWGHAFTVWQSDGYHFLFGAGDNGQPDWPGQIYTTGTIADWNGQSVTNPLGILTFTASIDPTRAWWLRDDTAASVFPVTQTEVLDGWVPLIPVSPPPSTIILRLPYLRSYDQFQLFAPETSPGAGETALGEPFFGYGSYTLDTGTGLDGMADYPLYTIHCAVPNPDPSGSGSYILRAVSGGQESMPVQVGDNDLRFWFGPTQALQLAISTSRWTHELLLRQPDGTAYPIFKHQTQGDVSFDTHGNAWQNNYYYFDATADYHSELPWYVEDASTGERLGPFQDPDATLIDWIALAAPRNLTAAEQTAGTFLLHWDFLETSLEGAFKLERRESDSEAWQTLDTIPALGSLNTTAHTGHATAHPAGQFNAAQVRIFYEYGGRRSAASNVVVLRNAGIDSDGDGLTDVQEVALGYDPYDPDTDKDGVWDGMDFAPKDRLVWANPADITPPFIQLSRPVGAVLVP